MMMEAILALAIQQTDYLSSRELREYCQSEATDLACAYYVAGYRDGQDMVALALAVLQSADTENVSGRAFACAPSEVTVDQVVRVFIRWVDEHPEQEHIHAAFGLQYAVSDAWPCQEQ